MRNLRSQPTFRWLLLMTTLAVVAASCGGSATTTTAATATTSATTVNSTAATTVPAETTAATETTAAAGEPYRVALIYPGTADDLSWSNAWFDGAEQAMADNPNIEVESVELLNDPAAVVQQGSAFASQGFDMILIAHGAMVEPAITLADQFPDVLVCLAPYHPARNNKPHH